MRRREFMVRMAGVIGAAAPCSDWFGALRNTAAAGDKHVGEAALSSDALADSPLAKACAALAPGESAEFPQGAQSEFTRADLSWQTCFHHDERHGLIHLMGKPANANRSWHHQIYAIAENRWTVAGRGMWNNYGHIFGAFTMDHATGDLFVWRGGMNSPRNDHYRRAAWWKYETKEWGYTPVDIFDGPLISHPNGSAWHPNLYGRGDGGLVLDMSTHTLFWRKSNNAVESIPHPRDAFGNMLGVGVYWPARDAVIVGGSPRGARRWSGGEGSWKDLLDTAESGPGTLLKVTPNGGRTPRVEELPRPPIVLAGDSPLEPGLYEHVRKQTGGRFGSLHVHPGNPEKLLIVETVGPGAWTSEDGATWKRIEDHPFTAIPRVICSLRAGWGALWAIGKDRERNTSTLWKPKP